MGKWTFKRSLVAGTIWVAAYIVLKVLSRRSEKELDALLEEALSNAG